MTITQRLLATDAPAAAITTTKIPMLLADGFWKMAHESRTDFAMLLGASFLFLVGAGRWSVDARLVHEAG